RVPLPRAPVARVRTADLVAVLPHRTLDGCRRLLLDDRRRSGRNRLRSLCHLRQLDEAVAAGGTRFTRAVAAARSIRSISSPGPAAIRTRARWAGDSASARGDLVAVGTHPLFGARKSCNRLAGVG